MKTTKLTKLIIMGVLSLGMLGFTTVPTNSVQAATQGYVNYIPGEGIPVFTAPNGGPTGETLLTGTEWTIQDTSYDPKVGTWFKIGDSQWVNADFMVNKSTLVYDNGVALEYTAVVRTTAATQVYMIPGGYPTTEILPTNTDWQTIQVTTIHDGTTWYNVGVNQWIPAASTNLIGVN
ncbi:SLAP domain-containing protein [Agrilactobacillus yilanensis]|uniref:SLAP domain-containing protein n=1 Tax=Agrilactobacillus yilanensis TaxID=2485997 RepID=A0ABW4J9D2_9LACO|nr:SLAP domain-containing protein [Agrilactobacillus yilanensis]